MPQIRGLVTLRSTLKSVKLGRVLVCQTMSKFLSKLRLNEKNWSHTGDQKKAKFLKVINKLIIYKFSKEFINFKKKTNRVVAFGCKCFPNILKYSEHILNFPKIRRSRFIQTQTEEFSWYIWKFRFTVPQNYHWNTMKTRNPWVVKVGYDPTKPTWELKEYYAVSA